MGPGFAPSQLPLAASRAWRLHQPRLIWGLPASHPLAGGQSPRKGFRCWAVPSDDRHALGSMWPQRVLLLPCSPGGCWSRISPCFPATGIWCGATWLNLKQFSSSSGTHISSTTTTQNLSLPVEESCMFGRAACLAPGLQSDLLSVVMVCCEWQSRMLPWAPGSSRAGTALTPTWHWIVAVVFPS